MLEYTHIGSTGFAKFGNSYLAVELILSKKIPQSSTLLSSLSHLKRLQRWILTKDGLWRRRIMRWKTVSKLVPVVTEEILSNSMDPQPASPLNTFAKAGLLCLLPHSQTTGLS
jgi:hypothetical protein